MFEYNKNKEAMLYYLYMMSDGEVSYIEEKLFDTICEELKIDTTEKNGVIEKCKEISGDSSDIFSIIVREKVDEQDGVGWFRVRNESRLTRIIWNLVNLGYADAFYCENEKKIVNYLVDKWSIDSEIYQEMIDTAETMLSLSKKREWIVSTFPNGSEREKKEKQIDTEIEQLLLDIKLTIEEITM